MLLLTRSVVGSTLKLDRPERAWAGNGVRSRHRGYDVVEATGARGKVTFLDHFTVGFHKIGL